MWGKPLSKNLSFPTPKELFPAPCGGWGGNSSCSKIPLLELQLSCGLRVLAWFMFLRYVPAIPQLMGTPQIL